VQSQWKVLKKGGVEENKACWKILAKHYLSSRHFVPRAYVPCRMSFRVAFVWIRVDGITEHVHKL
jgi:hypothetical protein